MGYRGRRGTVDKRTKKWKPGSPWHKLADNPGKERGKQATNVRTPPQGACPIGKFNFMAEVYICEEKGRHKIGLSGNVGRRMSGIMRDEGIRPRIVATILCPTWDMAEVVEKYLHWALRAYRWDREWFVLPEDLIRRLKSGHLSPATWAVARLHTLDSYGWAILNSLLSDIPGISAAVGPQRDPYEPVVIQVSDQAVS